MRRSGGGGTWPRLRAPASVLLAAGAIALAVLLLAAAGVWQSTALVGRPFPGFLAVDFGAPSRVGAASDGNADGTRILIAPFGRPTWGVESHPGLYGARLLTVDGNDARSIEETLRRIRAHPPGTRVAYGLRTLDGQRQTVVLPTRTFAWQDWFWIFGPYLLNGVVLVSVGLALWTLRPHDRLTRLLLACGVLGALGRLPILLILSPEERPWISDHLYLFGQSFLPAAALRLALLFPLPSKRQRLSRAAYLLSAALFAGYEVTLHWSAEPMREYRWLLAANVAYLGLVMGLGIVRMLLVSRRLRTPLARRRVHVVMAGALLGFGPSIAVHVLWVAAPDVVRWDPGLVGFTPLLFAAGLAYAALRHGLFEIDLTVRRTVEYVVLTGAVGAAYALVLLVFNLTAASRELTESPAFPVLFALATLLVFNPLRSKVQSLVDRLFFGSRLEAAKVLAEAAAELSSARSYDQVAHIVLRSVARAIPSKQMAIFVSDPSSDGELRELYGKRSLPVVLCDHLDNHRIVTIADENLRKEHRDAVREALASIGAEIAAPLAVGGTLVGVIALGEKRSAVFYTPDDAEFLRALAHQAAIALQNASSYEQVLRLNYELDQRVRERTAELERANLDLRKAYRDLASAELELVRSEKLASLGRLVAGVAHEINNPVSFIATNVAPLARRLDDADAIADPRMQEILRDARDIVDVIGRGAERTASIVRDLQAFSRAGASTREPTNIHDAVELAIRLLAPRWTARIEIHRDYQQTPPIEANAGQLNQLFTNLLANSCDAIHERGCIWITTRYAGESVVVSIRDDGVGMTSEERRRVFEPFFTTKEIGSGTGLGLAISHGIVTGHGGRIEVESEVGAGSTFCVTLPLRVDASSVAHERDREAEGDPRARAATSAAPNAPSR